MVKVRRTRAVVPAQVDKAWFVAQMADKKLTFRRASKLLAMPAASFTRFLQGKRRLLLDEAADFARILGVSYEEVVARAGVALPGELTDPVAVDGVVTASGLVGSIGREGARHVQRPTNSPPGTVALRATAPGHPTDGWLFFYVPGARVEPEAVGRLCIAMTSGGKRMVRVLGRGVVRGTWSLVPLWTDGEPVETVLAWATPVIGIRC